MKNVVSVVCMIALMAIAWPTMAQTRDLVFEDDEEVSIPKNVDIPKDEVQAIVKVMTSIELTRDDKTEMVSPDTVFKSGDRVRIIYTPNVDAYVYWFAYGSSGKEVMLFPNDKAGRENFVKKNETYTIPMKGNFKFDETAGQEQLMLVMTPEKDAELEALADTQAVEGGTVQIARKEREDNHDNASTTRDLVFEEETDTEEPAVEVRTQVSKDIKQPFVSVWTLEHK